MVNKYILILVISLIVIIPNALAELDPYGNSSTTINTNQTIDSTELISKTSDVTAGLRDILGIVTYFCLFGVVAMLLISRGDSTKLERAKWAFLFALIGSVLIKVLPIILEGLLAIRDGI